MNHKILVIDDEPDIRQLLSITLTRMGLSAYCVENLKRAHAALKEHEFSLCLSDLKLPDGSGLEFVKSAQEKTSQTPYYCYYRTWLYGYCHHSYEIWRF